MLSFSMIKTESRVLSFSMSVYSLERFACVEVTPHPGDHSFVRELRDSGQLRSILTDSLNA